MGLRYIALLCDPKKVWSWNLCAHSSSSNGIWHMLFVSYNMSFDHIIGRSITQGLFIEVGLERLIVFTLLDYGWPVHGETIYSG